ncbi:MAG: IS4 family transposase [Deltaproteobacteria bacterium]|nr:IS4 family transposase [Deltaproteobacteria bacterium]
MSERTEGWAAEEFEGVNLGDKRLEARLARLCDRFSDSPESPINQACADWAETKAAYRFFQNENVGVEGIMAAHRRKTAARAAGYDTVLAIQDTSFFVYTSHAKTAGLGKMSLKKGAHVSEIFSVGLVMHACLAVTLDGVPLGLLDQKIFARKLRPESERRRTGGKRLQDMLPVEEKESYRWLEALTATHTSAGGVRVVTVCDREADFYDFFKHADGLEAPLLVRASQNRTVNRRTRYAKKGVAKLWDHMGRQPVAGACLVEVPRRAKTKHCGERQARTAAVNVSFASFTMNPPRNNAKHRSEELPDLQLNAVLLREESPPEGDEPVEWMLLTNLPVASSEEACEMARWYNLRWRIEMYFKVLKSGFRVEACRLASAERLARYLAVMSVVAWRLFMITLIARADPNLPCSTFLAQSEWKALCAKVLGKGRSPDAAPTVGEAVTLIARLGGYLARKRDGPPGTLALWRGWKRLTDLAVGWSLAQS